MKNDIEYIVYYIDDKPDTVYAYYHKPKDGSAPHGVIFGYWLADEDGKKHYHECNRKKHLLMPYDHLMNKIIPDKSSTKSFKSISDFEKEEFLKRL